MTSVHGFLPGPQVPAKRKPAMRIHQNSHDMLSVPIYGSHFDLVSVLPISAAVPGIRRTHTRPSQSNLLRQFPPFFIQHFQCFFIPSFFISQFLALYGIRVYIFVGHEFVDFFSSFFQGSNLLFGFLEIVLLFAFFCLLFFLLLPA